MSPALSSWFTGLAFGFTLIVAIGAQNAFVLRQGLLRRHVLVVVAVCAISDAVLIVAGVGGAGYVVEQFPGVLTVVTWAGAAFLVVYGLLALRRAIRPATLDPAAASTPVALAPVLLTCLALTWLNPHVYLDTVVLLGSVAQGSPSRWWFAAGAATGSVVWFSVLGFGARLLRPIFAKAVAWRVLDSVVAVTMVGIAVGLVVG